MPLPAINFGFAELKEYFMGRRRSMYYEQSVKKRKEFLPHSDGEYPADVIERQRPNEPDKVKEFRKEIWQPITKPKFSQIVSSLGKIRRSSDWSIKYPPSGDGFSMITDGETLEQYCELDFPFFESITNWVFSVLVKPYLIDPNAVVVVMPLEHTVEQTEYLRPYPYIFHCQDVFDFVPNEYAILRNPKGSSKMRDGSSFFVITTARVQFWEQINAKTYVVSDEWEYNIGELTAFKLGGIISESHGQDFLFESRIAGVLPNLNESVAEYTDLQAAKRLHVYPERWQYSQHECVTCKGAGVVKNPNYIQGGTAPMQSTCGACGGLGYVANTGPYSMMLLKPPQAGSTHQPPNPPAGFIEKDVEIVRIMDESWRRHIYDALAAINFQFLDQTPLNQSGTAKEVDKEELNNTVHAIAEDLVRVMDKVYKYIAYYRYGRLYTTAQIDEMLPSIAVPEHFDLLSSQFMQEEVGKAKASKLNTVIVNAMEVEYTGKRFINEPEVKDLLELILKLDPFPNISEEDKMSRLANKGITDIDYIISSNILSFVRRALNDNDDFMALELDAQNKILQVYAQQQIDAQKQEQQKSFDAARDRNQPPEGKTGEDEFIIEEEQVLEDA